MGRAVVMVVVVVGSVVGSNHGEDEVIRGGSGRAEDDNKIKDVNKK